MKYYLFLLFLISTYSELICQEAEQIKTLTYIDLCNSEGYLSEWIGKVVFISFWSKTCGPCIRGFKNDNGLRNELTEKGVVLLNVSIDSKQEGQIAYDKYRPVGVNSIAKSFEQAQDDFEIFNLPVYVTIDKNGHQVEYDKMQYGDLRDFVDWYQNEHSVINKQD